VFTFAATSAGAGGLDAFSAGGFIGAKKSVELVKCRLKRFGVPTNAYFVIEGYVDPKEPLRTRAVRGITRVLDFGRARTLSFTSRLLLIGSMRCIRRRSWDAAVKDFYIGGASVKFFFLPIFK